MSEGMDFNIDRIVPVTVLADPGFERSRALRGIIQETGEC